MPRYNHTFDLCFSVDSDFDADDIPVTDLLDAAKKRVNSIVHKDDLIDAFGYVDTTINED